MGFFDLNVPYHESTRNISNATKSTLKTTRLKLVTKSIELGYSGAAYNNTIKGVMSESDRCSIPLFPLSSILKLAPSLSASVKFHRQLLNVPVSSPFRQYTRLTVIVDSPSQAAALNNGNPILKTYDIVAVRPVNQNAFEQACQTAEVDIISIDFSDKLPFRLKQPMVKAAIERGVYFEIMYSTLISDAQGRRQMISNAKLLVDWTRGKNLIFSSGASSVIELRGPYDVANLSSLLGLTLERAKAAISKNCRSVIASALRKKHCYKEVIKVEKPPRGGHVNFDDWLKWDPISSGDGDLVLDDMEKSFSTSNIPKTAKSIDFASTLNGLPSHGLQIKDLITVTPAVAELPNIRNLNALEDKGIAESVCEIFEQPQSFSFVHNTNPVQAEDLKSGGIEPDLPVSPSCTLSNVISSEGKGGDAVGTEKLDSSLMDFEEAKPNSFQPQSSPVNNDDKVVLVNGTATTCAEDTEIIVSRDDPAIAEIFTQSSSLTLPTPNCDRSKLSNSVSADLLPQSISFNRMSAEIDGETIKEPHGIEYETVRKCDKKLPLPSCDESLHQNLLERERLLEAKDPSLVPTDQLPVEQCYDQFIIHKDLSPKELPSTSFNECLLERVVGGETIMEARDCSVSIPDDSHITDCNSQTEVGSNYSIAEDEPEEQDTVKKGTQIDNHAGTSCHIPDDSPSGKRHVKRKASRRISLLPFKHFLNLRPLKKARKLRK